MYSICLGAYLKVHEMNVNKVADVLMTLHVQNMFRLSSELCDPDTWEDVMLPGKTSHWVIQMIDIPCHS